MKTMGEKADRDCSQLAIAKGSATITCFNRNSKAVRGVENLYSKKRKRKKEGRKDRRLPVML